MTENRLYRGFWQLADPPVWMCSLIPSVVGAALAAGSGAPFGWRQLALFFCAYLVILLVEIGKNGLNEVTDFLSGVDGAVDEEHRTPFSGGKKAIITGSLSLREAAVISAVTLTLAGVTGLFLVWLVDFRLLYFGAAGLGLAVLYSLPPFRLCYRGWGELAVGLAFGPVLVCGFCFLLGGGVSLTAVLTSAAVGFLIANVLIINEFPDYEADLFGGKKNLVVRLGKKRSVALYGAVFLCAYLAMIITAIHSQNIMWLLGLFTLPQASKAYQNCRKHCDDIPALVLSNRLTIQLSAKTMVLLSVAALFGRLAL